MNREQRPAGSPEEFGPLTTAQKAELDANPYKDDDTFTLEKQVKRYGDMLKHTPAGDPARRHLDSEHMLLSRCLELKRRERDYGVSETVDLTIEFSNI